MDGLQWKTLLKLMIWGYHYFRKHPDLNLGKKNILNVNEFINCPSILQAPFFNFPPPQKKNKQTIHIHNQPVFSFSGRQLLFVLKPSIQGAYIRYIPSPSHEDKSFGQLWMLLYQLIQYCLLT